MSEFSKLSQKKVNSAKFLAFRKHDKGYNIDMRFSDNGDKTLKIEVADGVYTLDEDTATKVAKWMLYRISDECINKTKEESTSPKK